MIDLTWDSVNDGLIKVNGGRAKTGADHFQFRDFCHCARTRWAAAGLPFEVAEIGLGHKIHGMAGRYTNLTDDQIREAFQNVNRAFTRKKRLCQDE